jgi:polynucleotide 5'-hydroxyl-kinase GRC3/NOL9
VTTGAAQAVPEEYGEWRAALEEIADAGGAVMVIGPTDVGKTTFTRLLANHLVGMGQAVAILDADPGQSEIGPPGCAGLAFPNAPILALSDLAPTALAFIGGVSPAGRLPEHITAVRSLADAADGRRLIVDTSGYVQGPQARRLLQCEIELIRPAHVVALHRTDELAGILATVRRSSRMRLHAPGVPAAIVAKPAALRAQRRAMRFSAYFRDAAVVQYAFRDVAFVGCWLGSGDPVPPHMLRFLNDALRGSARIYHAELSGRHLGLMSDRPVAASGPEMGIALAELRAREVTVTPAPRLKHLLVGMEAPSGKLLGLGLVASIDFRRGQIGLLTPVSAVGAASVLRFGVQRIEPDGRDAGTLRPGDL